MAPINLQSLVVRDGSLSGDPGTFYLLVVLTILFFVGCLCIGALLVLRRIRNSRQKSDVEGQGFKSHRRSRHPPSISITNEKAAFLHSDSAPSSPVPEIRITFPEEESTDGKRQSRVVVVHITEKGGVGYEPYEEQLPAYEEKESGRFQSLDLERIGGLKEKSEMKP
jgi:hypothetical protein